MGDKLKVSLITPQYLPWRYMIPRDLVLSTVLAFGERVAERIFLPGLHRTADRIVDPARIDDLSVLVGHSIALMILLWMFFLGLYTISIFTKRPIKPYATAIVGAGLMIVVLHRIDGGMVRDAGAAAKVTCCRHRRDIDRGYAMALNSN